MRLPLQYASQAFVSFNSIALNSLLLISSVQKFLAAFIVKKALFFPILRVLSMFNILLHLYKVLQYIKIAFFVYIFVTKVNNLENNYII